MPAEHTRRQRRCIWVAGVAALAAAALTVVSGCSRDRYRRQADAQVYGLVDQVGDTAHSDGVATPQKPFTIAIDPRSRMYSPYSPDYPPMPPDDPAAHRYMELVDGKHGWRGWGRYGKTNTVQSPFWKAHLPLNSRGQLVLDKQGAMELARIHSPDYQSQLEELYLSALDVTFERFRFDTQFFGGSSLFFTADGKYRSGTGAPSSRLDLNVFDPSNQLRAERLFAGGGELVVGLANSLVWQFAGPDEHEVTTLLDFSLVQPLLRGAGRAVVLERLTLSERTLLENVRQMERYRRGFYADIVTGRDAGQGPSRRGGLFGGAGLEGFRGVGGGGFGRVGNVGTLANTRIGGTGTGAGAAGAGGYLGLLQARQEIRNQEANVAALRVSLAQLRAFRDAGRLGTRGEVQVGFAESALYDAESRLLTSKALFQSELDDFKLSLGLPPGLDLNVEDTLLNQFNLIDPSLVEIQGATEQLLNATRKSEFARLEQAAGQPAPEALTEPLDVPLLVKQFEAVLGLIDGQFELMERDFQRLANNAEARRAVLRRLAQRPEAHQGDIDPGMLSVEEFDDRVAQLLDDYRALRERFACDRQTLDILRSAYEAGEDLTRLAIPCREAAERLAPQPMTPGPQRDPTPWTTALTELSRNLLEATLIQARIRTNSVVLLPVDLDAHEAMSIASVNRRDWMNARSELVNTWRLIEFNANTLKAGLDVVFSGDISNHGLNPVKLDGDTGRLRVGLQFDSPLTRMAERNVYRQSLIEYQQARRQYYTIVDRIQQGLRQTIRAIRLNDLNFELRREGVLVALRRYHVNLLDLTRPAGRTAPAGPGQVQEIGGEDFGATTARDLVDALSGLLNAQNDFLSVWVNYEVQRLSLDFDMGTMELDARGMWIDPGSDIGVGRGPEDCDPAGESQQLPNLPELVLPLLEPEATDQGGDAAATGATPQTDQPAPAEAPRRQKSTLPRPPDPVEPGAAAPDDDEPVQLQSFESHELHSGGRGRSDEKPRWLGDRGFADDPAPTTQMTTPAHAADASRDEGLPLAPARFQAKVRKHRAPANLPLPGSGYGP